ncbi:MAG: hypothetical protein MI741_06515, partial [Rhodospirillales bacterium]|nr:hypothetical protein [Rhodospirillales bacterium]
MSTGAERLESFLRTATLFRLFAELTRWLLRAAGLWLLLLIFVVLFDAATGMGRLGLLTLNAL